MTVILDANVLLRLIDTTSTHHPFAVSAINSLRLRGDVLRVVPQCLYELWVVMTRPIANNGLGLTATESDQFLKGLLATFPLLNDLSSLFIEWWRLVSAHACYGKTAHDARYVATMKTHGIVHILTFNVIDFQRFPGITVLDPAAVVTSIP